MLLLLKDLIYLQIWRLLLSNLVTESILCAVLLLLYPELANVHVKALIFPCKGGSREQGVTVRYQLSPHSSTVLLSSLSALWMCQRTMAGLPLGTGGTSSMGGIKCNISTNWLILPGLGSLARLPPPHSDNKYHGGRKHAGNSSSFTLHISTTSKRYTFSSIKTLSKIIGLQG